MHITSLSRWTARFIPLVGVLLLLTGVRLPSAQANPAHSEPPTASLEPVSTPAPRSEESRDASQDASQDAVWAQWDTLPLDVRAKVDPRILGELRGEIAPAHVAAGGGSPLDRAGREPAPRQQTRYIVYLRAQVDLAGLERRSFPTLSARRGALVESLRQTAESSQTALRRLLSQRSVARQDGTAPVTSFQPFFVVNAIAVEGDLDTLVALAQREDVDRISANYPLIPILPVDEGPDAEEEGESQGQSLEASPADEPRAEDAGLYDWNLELVQADRVHQELGIRGAGAVVGGFDSGVNYRHPALLRQYRGNSNGVFDHNYNWFVPDPKLYPNGDLGPSVALTPDDCASSSHGTHTMGTMVGEAPGKGPTIGMAPDARWIAVPGICSTTMPGGVQDDIGGIKAFQWFLCPTDLTGSLATADCSLAPDAVNNSWGYANPADDTFRPIIQVLRAAGVTPVFAAGNPSAGAGSIGSPASAPEAIAVGATTFSDNLSYFSGQGPSFWPGEQKPELTAPGSDVRSSVGSSGYDDYSGTSMAAPHVAGLIALLVSADLLDGERDFTVDELENFMAVSALDLGEPGPDGRFGYGRIDSWAAVQLALNAGYLRGQILDQEYNRPLGHALLQAHNGEMDWTFTTRADASGSYSLTLPAGNYQVTISRWGYVTTEVGLQPVIAGGLMLADFRILSRPQAQLRGTVRNESGPVANALIYAAGDPAVQVRSGGDGSYQLSLPLGSNDLVVEAPGHRVLRFQVHVPGLGAQMDLSLRTAPRILVVDPTPLAGWFLGRPLHLFFTRALAEENYLYDLWRIQYHDFFGTAPGADGSTIYGLPSAATLKGYDIVVWLHSFCNDRSCDLRTLADIGFEETLIDYLDSGGRLFVSGQDWAYTDRNEKLFNVYMQATYLSDDGGYTGMSLRALDFLEGLELELTNASLYGYPNGINFFAPDAVIPRAGGYAFPVLEYGRRTRDAAALAVAPCDASYRIFYLAAGLENVAPRGYEEQPDWTKLVDRAIVWLHGEQRQERYAYAIDQTSGSGVAGAQISYSFSLANLGTSPMRFAFNLQNQRWPTQILWEGSPVSGLVELPACSSHRFTVQVQIPFDSQLGELDTTELTVSSASHPFLDASKSTLQTQNMVQWIEAPEEPDARYDLGAVGDESGYHIFGGRAGYTDVISADHWRYDACTQQWESRAPLPVALSAAAVGRIGDHIYVAGGERTVDGATVQTNSLYIYDRRNDSWAQGPPMPQSVSEAAGATLDGKFYVFGGWDGMETSHKFYVYDPGTGRWEDLGVIRGGERRLAAAVGLDGHIYLVGGLPWSSYFARYTPASGEWIYLPGPNRLRVGSALVAAGDGKLYALGGTSSARGYVERYDPGSRDWLTLNRTLLHTRVLPGAAYAEGKLFLVGGRDGTNSHESLRLTGGFCESGLLRPQTVANVDGEIVYTVEMQPGDRDLPNVRVFAPLHPNQEFAGFALAPEGVRWTENHAVEWTGSLPANASPIRFAYTTTLKSGTWQAGDRITHTVQMDNGAGRGLLRSATSQLFTPDFAPSAKAVSRAQVSAGDAVTYTITLGSSRPVGGPARLTDTLPVGLEFVEGSISQSAGAAVYDSASRTLTWQGTVAAGSPGFVNLTDGYVWSDNQGRGFSTPHKARWQDIRESGQVVVSGFDVVACNVPIGFSFPFFGGETFTQLCVDVSGLVTLTDGIVSPTGSNLCPLPTTQVYAPRIATVWTNLAVDEGVFVQTLGQAPNRYTVIQWAGAYYRDLWDEFFDLPGTPDTDFQLVLYESGRIDLNVLRIGADEYSFSTTGLLGPAPGQRLTYQCEGMGNVLRAGTSVIFLPPGGVLPADNETVSFQTRLNSAAPVNQTITNTVHIAGGGAVFTRTVPLVVNPIDLSASTKRASRTELLLGESVFYTITLRNQGLAAARSAAMTDTLPAGMTYVPGSLACSGGLCNEVSGTIGWQGEVLPGGSVTVTYGATLATLFADRTPLTNTAYIRATGAEVLGRSAVVLARGSGLGLSYFDFGSRPIEPGDRFVFSIFLRNTGVQSSDADFVLPLPNELIYVPNTLRCGVGNCRMEGNQIHWSGALPPRGVVALLLDLRLAQGLPSGQRINVQGQITDKRWNLTHTLNGGMYVALHFFMPRVGDGKEPPIFLPLLHNNIAIPPWVVTPTPTRTPTPTQTAPAQTATPTLVPVSPLPTPTRSSNQP